MLSTGNIIYGFCKTTNPPKEKYLISLYRDKDINVLASFTTSLARAGVLLPNDFHGVVKNNENPQAYVFSKDKAIGIKPTGEKFKFPRTTTIRFDYCLQSGEQDSILKKFNSPRVECTLNKDEHIDLLYAMYKSPDTKQAYLPMIELALNKLTESE